MGWGSVLIAERDLLRSLGTTIGIRDKFESPESHRSDFGGERKPISNSDQIRSVQKWRLSIPPDSSRRDEALAPNRIKIGRRTHPHAPLEVSARQIHAPHARQRKETMAAPTPHFVSSDHAFSYRITPCGKPRMKDMEGDEQEDDWADQTMHWTRVEGDVTGEDISKQSLNEEACGETSERDYSGGTNEQVPESHKKRSKEEAREEVSRRRRDKKNCPRNKAQDQSSKAATIAMMAVDESDVLLAASADEESDWISDSGIAYHLCRDREVFSTHVACKGLVRMANDAIVGKGQSASGGTLKVSKENRRSYRRRKTGRLYRLRENVQTRGAVVRHRPSGSGVVQEHKEMLWDTCESLARHEKMQPVQDVHGEAQRRETESMYNDRRDVAEASIFCSRYVMVISPVVHTREERWSHDDLQSDVLCSAPRSYRRAGPKVIGMDNLKNLERKSLIEAERRKSGRERRKAVEDVGRLFSIVKNGGMNELIHELI
ncbi:hypothetical protein Acr_18g0006360 [Actinidia rufa]|uniref:Uncharacterized protein n=1 Tax=Actinidia rufa TaxID=165716 RepID=A0A7J0G6Q5_9ERIC|nr:hypothetical protein Acr_18g0006360 [Actinidia rufa]